MAKGEFVKGKAMNHFVEIRSYNLKLGIREKFHRLVIEHSMPILKRWTVDVLTYSPSLYDD